MKDAIIYVPQGRGAYLTIESIQHWINAAYTCDFSTCHILVAICHEGIFLFHIDALTNIAMVSEKFQSMPIDSIYLLHRGTCPQLRKNIYEYLNQWKITETVIPPDVKGISVSFQYKEPDIHRYIKLWRDNIEPSKLLHHPQEKAMTAIQKIEQLIGLKQRAATRTYRAKMPLIFFNRYWMPVSSELDCALDLGDSTIKKEFDQCQLDSSFDGIVKQLSALAESLEGIPTVGFNVKDVAEYLEFYMFDYDYSAIFVINMQWLLDKALKEFKETLTPLDAKLVDDLTRLLQNKARAFEMVNACMNVYIRHKDDTKFSRFILDKYILFCRNYKERRAYDDIETNRNKHTDLAVRYNSEGVKQFRLNSQEGFIAAANLFASQLLYLEQVHTADNPDIASCYYNIGRCCFKRNLLTDAEDYLKTALQLVKTYAPNSREVLLKYQNSVDECMRMISSQASHANPPCI